MSWHPTENDFIRDPAIGPYEKTVFGILQTFRNNRTGLAFPSLETVAALVPCTPRRAQTAIKALEAAGYIKVRRGRHANEKKAVNVYELPRPKVKRKEGDEPKRKYDGHRPHPKLDYHMPTPPRDVDDDMPF